MERVVFQQLLAWKSELGRKPLLVRGARQVGKTHLVRVLGETFPDFVEINLEEGGAKLREIFEGDLDPARLLLQLSVLVGREIVPGRTLLFLDEIQAAPRGITALRYFYEEMPELHVIAAGSLIEFAIRQHGLPVGRIESLYVYPMSFLEFLSAAGAKLLAKAISQSTDVEGIIHDKAMKLFGEYLFVGGMPEAVQCWLKTRDVRKTARKHQALIDSYRDDFQKYTSKAQLKYVQLLFDRIPWMLGKKFKYSAISDSLKKRELGPALDLLVTAGVVHLATHSSAQGIPLGAQAQPEKFKVIFLDVALAQAILGSGGERWIVDAEAQLVNQGQIVEAFVGQELLAYTDPHFPSRLFYWHEETRGSLAEVDYVAEINRSVIPVEVKSGHSGRLKSLHHFLSTHRKSPYGLRFYSGLPATTGSIRSLPLYCVAIALSGANSLSKHPSASR